MSDDQGELFHLKEHKLLMVVKAFFRPIGLVAGRGRPLMLKKLLFVLALFGLVSSPLSARAQVITVVADEWPPFSGEALPNKGISLDVITTVLRRAGYAVEAKVLPWARIMEGARGGEHDIVGSLFYDAELEAFMTYGDSYFETDVTFVQRKGGKHRYTDLDALRPYSIAVGDGFLYADDFDRADFLNKIVVTTAIQGVRMVAYDRADLTLDSAEVIEHAIRTEDPSLAERVEFVASPLATRAIRMAVRNDLPHKDKLISDFNRVLDEMRKDGSLDALLKRHRSH
jgi:polar amino acid transport system substrate-binding protein